MRPTLIAACLTVAVGLLALLAVRLMAHSATARNAANWGVLASMFVGWGALGIKRLALRRGLNYALGSVGITFVLRMGVLALGIAAIRASGGDATAFTLGFMAVFGVHVWVELGYLVMATRKVGR